MTILFKNRLLGFSLKTVLIPIVLLYCITPAFAQKVTLVTNAQTIDPNRYQGIEGTPYIYKKWLEGKIIDNKGLEYMDVLLNYNGYEREFEVKRGENFAAIDNKWYKTIELTNKDGSKLHFERGLHERFNNRFLEVLYRGEKILFVKDPYKGLSEKTIQNYGKTEEMKRFMPRKDYYFIKDGKLILFKLKKKTIFKELGHQKDLESWTKKNKVKVETEEGLSKLLAYYEKEILK